MMDKISKAQRSANMRAVRSANTQPEMRVRQIAHGLGYRFRLHRRDLPGKPDIIFPAQQKAIFVHGCFWHQHKGCQRATIPKSNAGFWRTKLSRNAERDARNLAEIRSIGWRALIVWECETRKKRHLAAKLRRFLSMQKRTK